MMPSTSFPRSARILAGPLGAVLLLAACAPVGPNFTPPTPPADGGYLHKGEAAAATPASTPQGPQAILGAKTDARWWTAFGSPELNETVELALANNPSIEAADATLARGRAELAAVRGTRLPQVDANARVDRQTINFASYGFPGDNPTFTLYSVGGGVSYDLDLFGGRRRQVEQTAAQTESRIRQLQAARLSVAGNVVVQSLIIASLNAEIDLRDRLITDDQRNVDLVTTRQRAGEGTMVEVLNAQSQLAADRAELPALRQQLSAARHMLSILVGQTPGGWSPPAFDLAKMTLPQQIPVALPSELVHKRPDILEAEADLHAATAAIGVATARLYPDITLGATISQGAPDIDDVLRKSFRGWDLFGGLTAPIFHGGTLKAERHAAVEEARASGARYRQTLLSAFGQVADLLTALSHDQQSVSEEEQASTLAQKSLHLSRRSFQVGNSGVLQVLDAQRVYQRAMSGVVEARSRQYLNVARLYVATAGGW